MNNDNYIISGWEDEKLSLNIKLIRGIYSNGFENPSSIQKQVLYPMIKLKDKGKNRDIIAQAQSGTGKTGAFTVGMLELININKNKIQGIILAPTHELAEQINDVVLKLGHYLEIKSLLLVGGTSVELNKKELTNNTPHLIVGTPGRIHDMIRRKYLKTDNAEVIVLDEADEMLSQGFKDQMYKIFQFMPNNIQIALFSATMPPELESLTKAFMEKPVKILVKAEMLTLQGIAQWYVNVENDEQKYLTLKDIFTGISISQAIIYCNSTRRVDDLHEAMVLEEFPVKKIHGKMDETERKNNHNDFRNGSSRVLITSDLFARGIDVQQVSVVINFDVPKSEHTYLHRIGRSGRWGRKGVAINFITKHDSGKIKEFEQYYSTQISEMPGDWTQRISM